MHTDDGTEVFSQGFHSQEVGQASSHIQLIWAHGWGQSGEALLPLAESLGGFVSSTVIDFPGFGASPPPPTSWGTADFADHMAAWLQTLRPRCRIWVGHSFGCRVGLQIAARHPGLLSGMVLLAAAGLPRKRSGAERLKFAARKYFFKVARTVVREGPILNRLRARMGSSDYKNAGAMRPILSRVVAEDLSEVAKAVTCPVLLIYGEKDVDTPPEIGVRLQRLIPNAELLLLPDFDHHTLLFDGRHQVASRVKSFAEKTAQCS